MEINKIHNVDFLELAKNLPAKCANLIIADPPYFEVKGDFDFIWPTFDAYLQDVEKWARACKHLLADNGSLYWWGHAEKIAYSQVVLDRLFVLINSIVWRKSDCKTRHGRAQFRMFAPVTERLLFYANQDDESDAFRGEATGWERVKNDPEKFTELREYFRQYQQALGITKKEIIEIIGQRADHCFRWGSSQWDLPTEETYADLGKIPLNSDFLRREYEDLRKEYEDLRKEYEDLRKEYESLRRPFFNDSLDDVWDFSQQVNITCEYDHPTQKTEAICKAIIETSSRPGDLVIVPFSGSGTEAAMAIKLGRNFYASEIDKKHCDAGNLRVSKAKAGIIPRSQEELEATGAQPSLFDLS